MVPVPPPDHAPDPMPAPGQPAPSRARAELTNEPVGFVVEVAPGERIHFLDWGGRGAPGVLAIHGLSNTAWSWTPVARRVRAARHMVATDLRGHGLSDAPTEGYDARGFSADVVAVAEGSGLLAEADDRVVIAGHGFGAIVGAWAALELGDRCAGLVLVDGGWESLEASSGMDVDEFLRSLDEPPEVLRSMAAYLADRAAFDAASWDPDQERAARATVVETHAGRLVPATRPHALEASVRAMFDYEPMRTLTRVAAPIAALVAGPAGGEGESRRAALADVSAARVATGGSPITATPFARAGHNLMRYRPDEVTAAILSIAEPR
jgi:pimeloyl-ACP methyl ester carboxylesterase